MTLVGMLLVFGLSYLVGADRGLVGFVEAWAIIGSIAFVGALVCLFMSLPRFVAKTSYMDVDDVSESQAERMFGRHMGSWAYGGFAIFAIVGALVANAVI